MILKIRVFIVLLLLLVSEKKQVEIILAFS